MAKNKSFEELHIVYSPQDKDNLWENEQKLISRLDKEGVQWMLSYEHGEAEGITHFDIVIWLKKEQRADKFNDKLRRDLKLIKGTAEYNIGIKTYGIEDVKCLKWYVGYNRKEEGKLITSDVFDFDLKDAIKYHSENECPATKKQVSNWSKDRIAKEYVAFLKRSKGKHDEEIKEAFLKKHIDKISLTNLEKVMDSKQFDFYLRLNDIEYNTDVFITQKNVLGLIEEEIIE